MYRGEIFQYFWSQSYLIPDGFSKKIWLIYNPLHLNACGIFTKK